MYKVTLFSDHNGCAKEIGCGAVYPLSMTQGFQSGDIYTDGKALLFHHDCGFAFLCGSIGDAFLYDVYSLMKEGGRRLVLFSEKEYITHFFEKLPNVSITTRYFYSYTGQPVSAVNNLYTVKKIDREMTDHLDGKITPSFSWNIDAFFQKGFGYAVICDKTPVSWAFSAAVSSDEVDIGVETAEKFRGKGLAKTAVNEMIKAVTASGKKPVWACHSLNTGSRKLAESTGFIKTAECSVMTIK